MSTGDARTDNEKWLRGKLDDLYCVRGSVGTLDELEIAELISFYESIADELARKDAELAELREALANCSTDEGPDQIDLDRARELLVRHLRQGAK